MYKWDIYNIMGKIISYLYIIYGENYIIIIGIIIIYMGKIISYLYNYIYGKNYITHTTFDYTEYTSQ